MIKSIEPAAASIEVPSRYLSWTPVILGALIATALSSILLAFGVTIGLGVSSTAPTWRDASAALWILSGLYLILQAALSFGVGGYIAGRTNVGLAALDTAEIEQRDGLHGLAAWALAVVLGVALAAFIGSATLTRPNSNGSSARTSAAEPLLSYEIDRLFRPLRRAANVDLLQERAEAGRILLTSSSHSGMSSEDRSYLAQLVAANTGLAGAEAEKRVDAAIATSQASIAKSRRSSVILAFSVAAAILLGAVIAVAAASVGGSHRDGAAMPHWMGARGSGAAYRREVA
ncbi:MULTISPECIES: hypothetical protein [unclassified Tardiphaga]|jgi:hypothetical protein|uniref:hypothetical protein n=1 Tax=unclassified Tardiphaga TaxID=2631404 RepID=UPI001E34D57E|nr:MULTISPECIES: hypothetical protein [unclassified Tardiphaga]UFS76365.1 hypothetical protein LPB73_02890 [Tardiphaga sp. 37S4]WNV11646.1 hypothetical protein RSO67_10935 [Tardiphaga sp. 709]